MLWYKGWLETRLRLLYLLGFLGIILAGMAAVTPVVSTDMPAQVNSIVTFATYSITIISILLAGTGVGIGRSRRGSTVLTLALPVTRFRLVAVRASLGWLEMAAGIGALCAGMWILFPVLRAAATPREMLRYAATLIACASGLYSIPMFLSTFLKEVWAKWGSMCGLLALWWPSPYRLVPDAANVFRIMEASAPPLAHAWPWAAMEVSLGLTAALFYGALKITERREY